MTRTLSTKEQASRMMRRLLFTADSATQSRPGYLDEAMAALGRHLLNGVQPGDVAGSIAEGSWEFDGPEHIVLAAGRDTLDAAFKAPRTRTVERHNTTYIRVPTTHVPALCRQLDQIDVPLAMLLRLALLAGEVDPVEEGQRTALEVLSEALRIEDLPASVMRQKVERVIKAIPLPRTVALRPFQSIGVAFVHYSGYRCLIGDSPGVGKTAQAIGALALGRQRTVPAVVVCPATVLVNWKKEIELFAPHLRPVIVETSTKPLPAPTSRTVYIMSSGLLVRCARMLRDSGVRTVVFDESQQYKNPAARRTKAAIALARHVPHVLLLSGTPMENHPRELWSQLHMVAPRDFPSYDLFVERFAGARERTVRIERHGQNQDRVYRDLSGGVNLAALSMTLRKYMIRRLKTDVRTDLPAKTRTSAWVKLPPASRAAYSRVEKEMQQWIVAKFKRRGAEEAWKRYRALLQEGHPGKPAMKRALQEVNADPPHPDLAKQALVRMGHLRRVLGSVKAAAATQWIRDYMRRERQPLVVFVQHKAVLTHIGDALTRMKLRWTCVNGSVKAVERGRRTSDFQAGKYDVILCSQAAMTGVNLQHASEMLFVERWWVPAWEEQAEDRIHRGGQTRPVQIHYLMAQDTIDDHIGALVDAKRVKVESVLGGERVQSREVQQDVRGANSKRVAQSVLRRVLSQLSEGHVARVTLADVKAHAARERKAG